MTSDELFVWMDNNLSLDYDDLTPDNIPEEIIRQAEGRGNPNQFEAFKSAMRGGFNDKFFGGVTDLRNQIESADTIQMIPMEDIGSVEPFFRAPLAKGLENKINEIQRETFEKFEGKIGIVKPKTIKKNIREEVDAGDLTSAQQKDLVSRIEGESITLYKELRGDIFKTTRPSHADVLIERGKAGMLSKKLISSLERAKSQQFAEV